MSKHWGPAIDEVFQQRAFQQSVETADSSRRCLIAAFLVLGVPATLLDIGCGEGHLVDLAAEFGVDSRGLDLYAPARERLTRHNLEMPWEGESAEMVLCLETAEHIYPEYAETLCETISKAVAPKGMLLFSAAIPGQGGSGHYNEQPYEYWRAYFALLGLAWNEEITRNLARVWSQVSPEAWWYGQNVQVYFSW